MTSASRYAVAAGLVGLSCAFVPQDAKALPELQIYIPGATYVGGTEESWIFSGAGSFELWVIGNVSGPGNHGSIFDVNLTAAVSTSEIGSITLAPTTASLLTDPSTPSAPTPVLFSGSLLSSDGAIPVQGDGSALPSHGIYGTGTSFYEWNLGDFTLTDSPMGDFINTYPTSFTANAGQINAYSVTVSGYTSVHFDAFDHYLAAQGAHYTFAPFSHDAGVTPIPEPEMYAMLIAGLGLMGFVARRRQRNLAAA